MDVSIIIPVYFNSTSLEILFNRIYLSVIENHKEKSFEVIFIDDGSKDNSLQIVLQLKQQYPAIIKVIKFTRNFGQGSAITAGFKMAKGTFIINIDADLQDPPELMNELINAYFKDGVEIAVATRQERKESLYRRVGSKVWYSIIQKLTFPEFPEKGFNYFGISKKVNAMVLHNVDNGTPFSNILIVWTGFPIKYIPYTRMNREYGKSKFTLLKKIKAMIDSLISFSFSPIRFMTILGIIVSLLGFAYAGLIMIAKFFGGENQVPFKGWAPIMILILVLSGFQMLMLGIIGEYLWRTLDITRKRSMYVIEEVFE